MSLVAHLTIETLGLQPGVVFESRDRSRGAYRATAHLLIWQRECHGKHSSPRPALLIRHHAWALRRQLQG
jgi:hypothetical protein